MVLKFSFPGTVLPQDGNAEIKALTERLNDALPGYEVSVRKDLVDLTWRGQMTEETGVNAKVRMASERYQAEVSIKQKSPNASDQAGARNND